MPPVELSYGKPSGLHVESCADGVAIKTGLGVQREIGHAAVFASDVDLHETSGAFFGAEAAPLSAGRAKLDSSDGFGSGNFSSARFVAYAIDDAYGKLDHIAAGDLKRDLRFDGERLHGFDVADSGAERAILAKPSASTLNEVTESLRLNETVASPVDVSVFTPAFQ